MRITLLITTILLYGCSDPKSQAEKVQLCAELRQTQNAASDLVEETLHGNRSTLDQSIKHYNNVMLAQERIRRAESELTKHNLSCN